MTERPKTGKSNEYKVGIMVLGTLTLAGIFAWVIGFQNPFSRSVDFYVTYNFAGGVQLGSPVRVSGIKVGKVEEVDFFVPPSPDAPVALKEPGSADATDGLALVPVRLKISVLKSAAKGIRQDSRFYINLAGIIGERYIEITPGSQGTPAVSPGQVFAGVDPPRIDQLISQSFNLAERVTDLVNENKADIRKSIEHLYLLSANLNKTLNWVDNSKLFKTDLQSLVNNLIKITQDMRVVTDKMSSPEGKKTLELLHSLLWRLEPLDSQNIRTFLQKEGVKVHLF